MADLHENKLHGQPAFPFTVYKGMLPEYIPGYPLHWHEEMELICVTAGTGMITIQAERYQVHPGDLVLIPPQTVHGIDQLDGETMEYYNILFRLAMLEADSSFDAYIGALYSKAYPAYLPKGDPLNEKLAEPVTQLIENRKLVRSDYALMIRSHLYAIVYHIVHQRQMPPREPTDAHTSYDRLKVVLEFLQKHYPEEITVHQAAAMCGFSDSHFMKLFRELTGTSFAQYVKHLRLDAAAGKLRSTGQRISEIAEAVGFHNLSYFTRAFEREYRLSPTAYREAQK